MFVYILEFLAACVQIYECVYRGCAYVYNGDRCLCVYRDASVCTQEVYACVYMGNVYCIYLCLYGNIHLGYMHIWGGLPVFVKSVYMNSCKCLMMDIIVVGLGPALGKMELWGQLGGSVS